MKTLTIMLALAFAGTLALTACVGNGDANNEADDRSSWRFEDTPDRLAPYRERAGNAFARLGSILLPRLQQAINEGGPESGIEVCKTIASEMTQDVADKQGFEMGRTSHKLRNPDNAPREWIKALVEDSAGKQGGETEGRVYWGPWRGGRSCRSSCACNATAATSRFPRQRARPFAANTPRTRRGGSPWARCAGGSGPKSRKTRIQSDSAFVTISARSSP